MTKFKMFKKKKLKTHIVTKLKQKHDSAAQKKNNILIVKENYQFKTCDKTKKNLILTKLKTVFW